MVAGCPQPRYGAVMQTTFYVMAGGAIGAGLRFHLSSAVTRLAGGDWPLGTLVVNLMGAMLMGILVAMLDQRGLMDGVRLFIGVGILGGFTTFSAFSLDAVRMAQAGTWAPLAGYILASVIGTMALLWIGMIVGRAL